MDIVFSPRPHTHIYNSYYALCTHNFNKIKFLTQTLRISICEHFSVNLLKLKNLRDRRLQIKGQLQ